MAKKSSTTLLVESGILPKNAISQLERHRMVPQGTAERAGTRPVSLENASNAARFARDLQKSLDDEELEFRLQDLAVLGERRPVWIQWSDGSMSHEVQALVDKLNRVYVRVESLGNGHKKKIKGVSFTGRKTDVHNITHTETRHEGEALKHIVCYLED